MEDQPDDAGQTTGRRSRRAGRDEGGSRTLRRSAGGCTKSWPAHVFLAKYYLYSLAYILPRPSIFSFSRISTSSTTPQTKASRTLGRSCLAYPRNRGWSGLMAAATVGRFVGTRARLVGARVESAELCMDTIGLHAQFGGFAQPLRPPSPRCDTNLSSRLRLAGTAGDRSDVSRRARRCAG